MDVQMELKFKNDIKIIIYILGVREVSDLSWCHLV